MSLADELMGEISVRLRGIPRAVVKLTPKRGRGVRPEVKKTAKKREGALAYRRQKADPEKNAARVAYTAQWRKEHPERVREYRRRYRKTTAARHYQREWMRKKRANRPPSTYRGENVPNSKLTEAKVREMRAIYAAGGTSMDAIAAQFGISFTATHKVIRRITWRHVE